MTMAKQTRSIAAGEFKAKCLALLDEVARTGVSVVVTKRGKAVARVVPVEMKKAKSLKGSVLREGDLLSPIDAEWDANA